MASVFKPTYTKTDKNGKRVTRKSKKWYVKYRDAEGIVRKIPGYTDKSATQQLAAKLQREAELGQMGIVDPFEKHRKTPLSKHLEDFRQHLRDKNNSDHHVHQLTERTRSIVNRCNFVFIDDVTASAVQKYLGDLRSRGRSIGTSNHYLRAIKQFCRWMVEDRRTGDNPIVHLKRLSIDTDRRRNRRALTKEEFARLIASAATGPPIEAVPGEERVMLYILAAWTGYRRKELASITLKSLDLDAEHPTLRVKAGDSKHRKDDVVPLHPVVVERLKQWIATKGTIDPDKPLFALRSPGGWLRRTSKMMRMDLERAGIPYQNEAGLYADFHSNRHTFISNLARANVSPKLAQSLARHGDVNLTMNIYTHVDTSDQSEAVSKLPAPPELVPKLVPTADFDRPSMSSPGNIRSISDPRTNPKKNDFSRSNVTLCQPVAADVSRERHLEQLAKPLPPKPKVTGSIPVGDTLVRNDLRRVQFEQCTQ